MSIYRVDIEIKTTKGRLGNKAKPRSQYLINNVYTKCIVALAEVKHPSLFFVFIIHSSVHEEFTKEIEEREYEIDRVRKQDIERERGKLYEKRCDIHRIRTGSI